MTNVVYKWHPHSLIKRDTIYKRQNIFETETQYCQFEVGTIMIKMRLAQFLF